MWVYPGSVYLQNWFSSGQYIRSLCTAVVHPPGILVVLMVEVLEIIYEVLIPVDLWLPWIDLQQSQLFVIIDPILWLGLLG